MYYAIQIGFSGTSTAAFMETILMPSSEFGDGKDFEHPKSIVFARSREGDFDLGSPQRGEMFKPVLRCARDIVL